MAKKKPTVAIVMGSKTDWPTLELTVKTLKDFGIESTVRVMSAHRTPHDAVEFAEAAAKNGYSTWSRGRVHTKTRPPPAKALCKPRQTATSSS